MQYKTDRKKRGCPVERRVDMAKKIDGYIKLQIPAGAATPAPPVGPALGQKSVNIMEFCSSSTPPPTRPVIIGRHHGVCRPFLYVHHKTPPAAALLASGGAGCRVRRTEPKKVGDHPRAGGDDRKTKMSDLNAATLEARPKRSKGRPGAWVSRSKINRWEAAMPHVPRGGTQWPKEEKIIGNP